MNWISNVDGLTARRWTIDRLKIFTSISGHVFSGRILSLVALTLLLCSSCNEKSEAQNKTDSKANTATVAADSVDKPKVTVKVNRHYDDKGNLVGFDSTYSSYYSNVKGDTSKMDSLMNSFDRYFNRSHSSFLDKRFNNLFFNDSLRYPDFFHNDFFMKRYELNDLYLRDMMRSMDSVKNRFFREHSKQRNDSKDL
jgi:hypothetical protein